MAQIQERVTEPTVEYLNELFAASPLADVSIRLWDGTLWPDEKPRAATVVLNHSGSLRAMLAEGTARGLGEAYLREDFEVEGDFEQAVELAVALENRPSDWLTSLKNLYRLHRLPASPPVSVETWRGSDGRHGAAHSLARDRAAVSFHYDVAPGFYGLWLDPDRIYSCGYFASPHGTLEAAQLDKCEHICRKLRLKPGQHLLDIGCGWGGLARYAARHFKVNVTGVTLSKEQAGWAAQQVEAEGLGERVQIELRDYREVVAPAGGFDAIVSVGMAEHVGRGHLAEYFRTIHSLLRPGGVFLNHAIGEGRCANRFHGPSFVEQYVFPDADTPPLPLVLTEAESASFEIRDVENLREHYALTLRHWVRRLEAAHEQALAFVSEPTYRVWRLYLSASAHGFAHGDLAVYQTLLAKPDENGRLALPLTRRDWYGGER